MKLLILAPLFPPDVGAGAGYAKRLSLLLAKQGHALTCLHYGELPETVPGVQFVSIKKDRSSLVRVGTFLIALLTLRQADAFLVLNGQSVELPIILARVFLKGKIIYLTHDPEAAKQPGLLKSFLRKQLLCQSLQIQVPETLLHPPLIHPLKPTAPETQTAYQTAWEEHVTALKKLL